MKEIAPGIFHWTTVHPDIGMDVSSYYLAPARIVVDPLEPKEGLGFFDELDEPPEQVVLSIGLHWRHSDHFADRYGCRVRAPEASLHRFEGTDRKAESYKPGDELAPGVEAVAIGGIAPDDMALLIKQGSGALLLADCVVNMTGEIAFVPDSLWDDPEGEQKAVIDSLRKALELDFDTLLFAHGEPIPTGGHAALAAFVENPVSIPEEALSVD